MTRTLIALPAGLVLASATAAPVADAAGETPAQAAQRKRRVEQRRGVGVAVICHRGASEFAHENTLDAYRATFQLRADGNEIDSRATRDGVLVCLHDDMLDMILASYGDVADYTWDRPGAITRDRAIELLGTPWGCSPDGQSVYYRFEMKAGYWLVLPIFVERASRIIAARLDFTPDGALRDVRTERGGHSGMHSMGPTPPEPRLVREFVTETTTRPDTRPTTEPATRRSG